MNGGKGYFSGGEAYVFVIDSKIRVSVPDSVILSIEDQKVTAVCRDGEAVPNKLRGFRVVEESCCPAQEGQERVRSGSSNCLENSR